jgi:hypothetical protein
MSIEFESSLMGYEYKGSVKLDVIPNKFHLLFNKKKMEKGFGIFIFDLVGEVIRSTINEMDGEEKEWGIFRIKILEEIMECYFVARRIELNINPLEERQNLKKFNKNIKLVAKHMINGQDFMLIPDPLLEISNALIRDHFGKFGYKIYTFG